MSAPPAPVATPMAQACLVCRTTNKPGAKFCYRCGKKLVSHPGTGNLASRTILADRFLVLQKIAQGGMGAVYLVEDTQFQNSPQGNKRWALKEMSQSILDPAQVQDAIKMFQREASMLVHLEHFNLPRVIARFEHEGKQYLVMDYIEGQTLEQKLREHGAPFSLAQVQIWARQLIGVLMYLHGQPTPIIYRDLKPNNIMCDQRGTLKLIDFGIARFMRTPQQAGGSADLGLATRGYAPPEQLRGGDVGPAADVYALGVTLHQLLTNIDPTQPQYSFNLPLACDVNPQVPRPVALVLARAYDPNLQRRIQTMREFEREFDQALQAAHGQRPFAGGGNPATPLNTPGSPPISFMLVELRAPHIIYAQTFFQARRMKQAAWCAAKGLVDRLTWFSIRLCGWDKCVSRLSLSDGRHEG